MQFRGEALRLVPAGYYDTGRPALSLIDGDGAPYARLTVNLPDAPDLPEGNYYVKTWSENAEVARAVLASGLMLDTGQRVPTGFVEAAVWNLSLTAGEPS